MFLSGCSVLPRLLPPLFKPFGRDAGELRPGKGCLTWAVTDVLPGAATTGGLLIGLTELLAAGLLEDFGLAPVAVLIVLIVLLPAVTKSSLSRVDLCLFRCFLSFEMSESEPLCNSLWEPPAGSTHTRESSTHYWLY